MIPRAAVLKAAHELYSEVVQGVWERLRRPCPRNFAQLCASVTRLDDATQLEIMWRLIGRAEQAWGYDVGLVFHHAGITGDAIADGLYYLCFGCQGTGLDLEDKFPGALDKAGDVLGKQFDPCPFMYEAIAWCELAEAAYGTPAD